MINREFRKCVLRHYAGENEYGQQLAFVEWERPIEATFNIYTHGETIDVRFQKVTHISLTKEKGISDADTLTFDGVEYKVQFVNPYGRLTELFLIRKR